MGPPSFEGGRGEIRSSAEEALTRSSEIRRQLGGSVERLLEEGDVYLHRNLQGSITVATADLGIVGGHRRFSPYGGIAKSLGSIDPYGFTGQERDDSTGLVAFKWRHLDSDSGKWLSVDPLFLKSTNDNVSKLGESSTGYAYVAGRVINAYDQGGLDTKMLRISSKGRHRGKTNAIISNRTRKVNAYLERVKAGGPSARVAKMELAKLRAKNKTEAKKGQQRAAMKKHAQSSATSDFISFAGDSFKGKANNNFKSLKPWLSKALIRDPADVELIGTTSNRVKGVENSQASGAENEWLGKTRVSEAQVVFRAEGVSANLMKITKHSDPKMVGMSVSPGDALIMYYQAKPD